MTSAEVRHADPPSHRFNVDGGLIAMERRNISILVEEDLAAYQ
jgi:hypothetical protein